VRVNHRPGGGVWKFGHETKSLTPWLTGAGSRRLEGTNISHENAEGMAYVGVRVEPTVRLGSVVETSDSVHSGFADLSGSSSLENTVETVFRA